MFLQKQFESVDDAWHVYICFGHEMSFEIGQPVWCEREADRRIAAVKPFLGESEVTGKLVEALEKIAATTCGCHHSADPDWHSDRCVVRIARAVLADAQVKERRDGK